MMMEAVIGLGSNIGNRHYNIASAIRSLNNLINTKVLERSNLYETIPVEVDDEQENYTNCCLKIETSLAPHVLLGACLGIESCMGRIRTSNKAARIIDIDLLLYDGAYIKDHDLILPHPQMLKRAFVLVPLKELYPDGKALGLDFQKAYTRCKKSVVKNIES